MNQAANFRSYLLVTACYWAFTISDGALRMLVLLHLHEQGQTAWALALLLVPYEVAGVVTNLVGGFLGARFGLKLPLMSGLVLQAIACGLLAVDAAMLSITYVMLTQVLSGVAKDLTKTSAKAYVRVLVPEDQSSALFRLVAIMTGSKNAMKGFGFFVGGAMLSWCGFAHTNLGLALLLIASVGLTWLLVPRVAGRPAVRLRSVFQQDRIMLWLCVARAFLFGSRDAWFAVALPLYLIANGWSSWQVGAFLAIWVIVYGIVQASVPSMMKSKDAKASVPHVLKFTGLLALPLLVTGGFVYANVQPIFSLMLGLCVYGGVFAVTSSMHSWLAVALHDDGRTAERVGFYYSANAVGRLSGTLVSGGLFALAPSPAIGLTHCLLASAVAVALACMGTVLLRREQMCS